MAMEAGRDWAERTLCDDGACTGIIGGDGACRVCGRPSRFWGDERRRGQQVDVDADGDGEEDVPEDRGPGALDDEDERRLCIDGGCIGLVGADGTCNVCGLDAGPAPARTRTGSRPDSDSDTDTDSDSDSDTDTDSGPDADDDRRLCPDGSCVGVLDARGVCKVCGRSVAEV